MKADWINCNFEDILTLKNGFAFKSDKYSENGTPVIRISDINDAIVKTTNAKKVQDEENYENYLVEFGDILIAMSGATTGKFGIYKEQNKAYQNQRVGNFKLHCEELINKNYIYYLLYALRRQIEKDAYGGAQPNISSKKIEAMQITLAPLLEQKAIVAKIEQLFSELDNGIANLKTAQAKLKIYRQAVLKKAFDECRGSVKIIDEVVTNISESAMPNEYGNYDFIGMDCINQDGIKPSFLYKFSEFKSAGKLFKINQLLYGRLRPYLNKVYLAEFDGVASGEFIIMEIDKQQVMPKFLMWLIHSKNFVNWANKQVSGDRPRIKFDQIKNFEFVLPLSLKEQNQIVQEIESRLSVCDKIEETIETSLAKSEALRQSILKKAFEGKLLSEQELENIKNNPEYESAEKLLKRIKKERSK